MNNSSGERVGLLEGEEGRIGGENTFQYYHSKFHPPQFNGNDAQLPEWDWFTFGQMNPLFSIFKNWMVLDWYTMHDLMTLY